MKKQNLFLTFAGLFLGLVGTLAGIYFSSSIENTSLLFGLVVAIWVAVFSGIVAGRINKLKEFSER